jgi:hypothetical protein
MGADMRSWTLWGMIVLGVLAPGSAHARYVGAYDYPFVSALAATVAATPPANQARLPTDGELRDVAQIRDVKVFPERPIPPVFWYYERGLPYAVYEQPNVRAPLFFIIGGTGAGFDSAKSGIMVRALYQAGFHVVSLSSPTHPSFIVTASEESIPGQLRLDANDLYRVMKLIDDDLKGEIAISGYYVGGYSLGGAHTAFVSLIDAQEKRFDFKKAVMINPPVNLFNSVGLLDRMLDRHLGEDPTLVDRFIDRVFDQASELYDVRDRIDFTDPNVLYRAYTYLEPPEAELEILIGLAFRLVSANLAFTSDVMTNSGYVVPKNARLTPATSLTNVFLQSIDLNFVDYFDDVYVPYIQRRFPKLTREGIISMVSLRSIEDYLRGSDRVVLLGTEDDPILARGEVQWLENVFGERARIFPTGGHCGSMDQREFVRAMLELIWK